LKKSEALTPEQLQVVNNVKKETLLSLQEIRAEFVEEISTSNTYEDVVEAVNRLCSAYFSVYLTVFEEYYFEGILVTSILNSIEYKSHVTPEGKSFARVEVSEELLHLETSATEAFSQFVQICVSAAAKKKLSTKIVYALSRFKKTAELEAVFKKKCFELYTGLIIANRSTLAFQEILKQAEASLSKVKSEEAPTPPKTDDEADFN
jgi:hypothetical protein